METDHSEYIRGLIRKEYARLHPLRIHPEGATTAYAFVTPRPPRKCFYTSSLPFLKQSPRRCVHDEMHPFVPGVSDTR